MKKTAILLAAMLMTSTVAYAGGLTGNDLLSHCQSDRPVLKAFCTGYVLGVVDQLTARCVPAGVTAGQEVEVVERVLMGNPEDRHLRANTLIALAVGAAWPCK
jgi:hypothetical protein